MCCITASNHDDPIFFLAALGGSIISAWGIVRIWGEFILTHSSEIDPDPAFSLVPQFQIVTRTVPEDREEQGSNGVLIEEDEQELDQMIGRQDELVDL